MIAEIICVGTELLLGETINTNASYLSRRLSSIGINCFYQSTVGDNPQRIKNTLDIALKRADVIIFTGGLGPTDDDLTISAISEYFNSKLVFSQDAFNNIKDFFRKIKREMPASNRKQAFIPEGARIINNPIGTAPGIIWEIEGEYPKTILAFPGVPEELYQMWEETAENLLKTEAKEVIVTRHLRYFGIAEAALADSVKDLLKKSNPTVAPLVGRGGTTLRIAAKAENKDKANAMINQLEKEILTKNSEYHYGYDNDTLETVTGKLLLEKQLTVSVAESCTGGLVSSLLTNISGSSSYIKANFVTYSNESKTNILGVNVRNIENFGAVSSQTALSMAINTKGKANCDIGIGITGIAGPTGGSEEKPVGLVYIAICNNHTEEIHELRIPSTYTREEIKYRAALYALYYLRNFILRVY